MGFWEIFLAVTLANIAADFVKIYIVSNEDVNTSILIDAIEKQTKELRKP